MLTQFTVILDSCVLYNAPVRDLLLQLASQGLFRAKWTSRIQEEWIRNLLKNRPDLRLEQLERTCEVMKKSILDCIVEDYEDLVIGIALPDPDDAHVIAAAMKSQAQIIVTHNLKDFPEKTLEKYKIEALDPDTFLRSQLDLNPPAFLSCVKAVRARLKNPPKTARIPLHPFSTSSANNQCSEAIRRSNINILWCYLRPNGQRPLDSSNVEPLPFLICIK